MPPKPCLVTLTDNDGVRHQVEVSAESLYEAAVLALAAFKADDWTEQIGPATRLLVEARALAVSHILSVQQVQRWLERSAGSPNDIARRRRLKDVLGGAIRIL
jgi:hypothetical protein